MIKKPWNDDVGKSIEKMHYILEYIKAERGQLYGTVIHLMKLLEMDKFPMPDIETLKDYQNNHYVLFAPEEEGGKFFVQLKDIEKSEDSDV